MVQQMGFAQNCRVFGLVGHVFDLQWTDFQLIHLIQATKVSAAQNYFEGRCSEKQDR